MLQSKEQKRVFLSSTAKDLTLFRDAVHHAIQKLEGYHCIRMEDFTSQESNPSEYLQLLIPNCDLFIGLLGLCYGSRPPGAEKSYTETEYDTAQKHKIPRLMFKTKAEFSVSGSILHADGGWDEQQSFRRRINKELIVSEFSSPSELAIEIITAIRN